MKHYVKLDLLNIYRSYQSITISPFDALIAIDFFYLTYNTVENEVISLYHNPVPVNQTLIQAKM